MKKLNLLFAATLGCALLSNAQGIKGAGYDAKLQQVVARIGLNPNSNLDIGLGFNQNHIIF